MDSPEDSDDFDFHMEDRLVALRSIAAHQVESVRLDLKLLSAQPSESPYFFIILSAYNTCVDENQESKGRVRLSPIDAIRKKTRSKPHKRASETTP